MQLLVWILDQQRYGLPLGAVERVVRAVAATPLPGAPDIVNGLINVHGRVTPVVDMRRRLNLPRRETQSIDALILAHTSHRPVAFFVDRVSHVADYPEESLVAAHQVVPASDYISGIVKTAEGMLLIHDLDRFLSLDEEAALEQALQH